MPGCDEFMRSSTHSVKNKGALGATQGQLRSIGPESGILDGDLPSAPYIYQKAADIQVHTCAYVV